MNYVSTKDVSNTIEFIKLKELAIKSILTQYNIADINSLESKGSQWGYQQNIDIRDDLELVLMTDNYLRKLLDKIGIKADFLQFPVNIRLFFPESDLRKKTYDTDIIHCDHWSSAPSDSQQGFLYLKVDDDSTYLSFYEYKESQLDLINSYRGAYENAPNLKLKNIQLPIKNGIFHTWDCKTPHKTIRRGNAATISIDFRLRNFSHVFVSDLKKTKDCWIKSKMTSLGVYWIMTDKIYQNIEDKIYHELLEAEKYGENYLDIRRQYINNFYDYK